MLKATPETRPVAPAGTSLHRGYGEAENASLARDDSLVNYSQTDTARIPTSVSLKAGHRALQRLNHLCRRGRRFLLVGFRRGGVSLVFFLGFADKNLGNMDGVSVVAGGAHLPMGTDDRSFLLSHAYGLQNAGPLCQGDGHLS